MWTADPKIAVYTDGMNNQFWSGYKGPITQAAGTVAAEYILVQMCASVAVGQATPEEAAKGSGAPRRAATTAKSEATQWRTLSTAPFAGGGRDDRHH